MILAAASLYGMEGADPHRQWRIPGVFFGEIAHNQGRRGILCFHVDGKRIFMGPEESMQIQSNLGSTIAMAFDECVENPAPSRLCRGIRSTDDPLAVSLPCGVGPAQQTGGYHQPEPDAFWH